MNITKAFGLVLAVALVLATGWMVMRPLPDAPPIKVAGSAPAALGAALGAQLVEVRLPASLSAEAAAGKTYYDAVCASCHSANAAGQDGVAPPLVHKIYEPSHHGDAAFLVAVRNGARQHHWSFGPMLPVKQKLTDGEIAAITLYIRELQRENGIM